VVQSLVREKRQLGIVTADDRLNLQSESLASSRFTDLTRDGKRIFMGLPQETASTPLTLLLNSTQNLRR